MDKQKQLAEKVKKAILPECKKSDNDLIDFQNVLFALSKNQQFELKMEKGELIFFGVKTRLSLVTPISEWGDELLDIIIDSL